MASRHIAVRAGRGPCGPRRNFGARRQQHGAVAIFVGISLIAVMSAVGFALDLGRLYAAKAELQKLASVSALSTVRQISGCSTGVDAPLGEDDLGGFVNDQLLLNGFLEDQLATLTSLIQPGSQISNGALAALDPGVDIGMADSVGVRLTRPLPPPLFPLLPQPQGAAISAEAHAAQTVVARVAVGSELLSLNSDESLLLSSLLGGMLNTAVNLTVADFQSLIDANLTLLDIVNANPMIASVEDFLNLTTSLPGALGLVSNALFDTGEAVEQIAAGLLGGLAAGANPPNNNLRMGDFIGVEDGFESQVGNLPINALDLLLGLSQLANEGYDIAFAVPNLVGLNIPGVANIDIDTSVRIGQAPQEAFGRPGYDSQGNPNTRARSSQVQVLLEVSLNLLGGVATVNLELALEAAAATADLAAIRCPTPTNPQTQAWVDADSAVARIAVGNFNPAEADPISNASRLEMVRLLGINLLVVDPAISVPVGQNESGLIPFSGPFVPDIDAPAPEHTQAISVSPGSLLSSAISSLLGQLTPNVVSNIPALGFLLAPVLNPIISLVLGLLEPIITTIGTAVLEPLLDILGITLGGAEITVKSVVVEQPYLFFTE